MRWALTLILFILNYLHLVKRKYNYVESLAKLFCCCISGGQMTLAPGSAQAHGWQVNVSSWYDLPSFAIHQGFLLLLPLDKSLKAHQNPSSFWFQFTSLPLAWEPQSTSLVDSNEGQRLLSTYTLSCLLSCSWGMPCMSSMTCG